MQSLKELKDSNIGDIRLYLDAHPDLVIDLMKTIQMIDINQYTLQLYEVSTLEELDQFFIGELLMNIATF